MRSSDPLIRLRGRYFRVGRLNFCTRAVFMATRALYSTRQTWTASNYNVYSLRAGTEFQSFGEQKRVIQADARDFLRKPADEVALVSA